MSLVPLNNETGWMWLQGTREEVMEGGRQCRGRDFALRAIGSHRRLWSRGGMESNLYFKTVNKSHIHPTAHMCQHVSSHPLRFMSS